MQCLATCALDVWADLVEREVLRRAIAVWARALVGGAGARAQQPSQHCTIYLTKCSLTGVLCYQACPVISSTQI